MVQQHFIQSTQLSQEERIEIYRHHAQGLSCRKIWKMLGRHHTSISREIARNSTDYWWWKTIYKPIEAERKKQERKRKANDEHIKLKKNNKLRLKIYQLLSDPTKCRWPDEILGYLKREWREVVVTSTLYRYIREYSDRWRYLRYKQEWYKYRKRKRKKTTTIAWVPKIDVRPEEASNRIRIGDREWDTIVSTGHSGWLFTAVERTSRYLLVAKIPNHKANTLLTVMTSIFMNEQVTTLTTDNWVEFSYLARLWTRLHIQPYTAHPYASYERGTNEKTNWFIRWFVPKWSNISEYTEQQISDIQHMLNHKPRKILGYRTPYEVYHSTTLSYL